MPDLFVNKVVDIVYLSPLLQKLSDDDNLDAVKNVQQEPVIKLGCDVNIRSIQDDEAFDVCVGSLIICCKPN